MRMETRVDALRAVGPAGPAPGAEAEAGPVDPPPHGEPSAAADGPAGAPWDGPADAVAATPEDILPDLPADIDPEDTGPGDADPADDPSDGADRAMADAGAEDAGRDGPGTEDAGTDGPGTEDAGPDDAPADDPVAVAPLVLPARVTQPMAESFLASVRAGGALPVIDARGVEHLSTAYALVLVSLARARAADGRRLAILAPSAAFVDAFADLGLFQDLMKMEFCQ